jgi:hypothetical protein
VSEGGGVRGIGLVGAVDALAAAGYEFPRVAGTSAGAIVASLVAALQAAGKPLTPLAKIMRSIDYPKFLDRNLIGHVPLIGGGLSLLVSDGVYRGLILKSCSPICSATSACAPSATCAPAKSPNSSPGRWSLPPVTCHDAGWFASVGPRFLWHRPGRLLGSTRGARLVGDSVRIRARSGRWCYLGRRWVAVELSRGVVRPA